MPEFRLHAYGALGGDQPFSRRWRGCSVDEAPDRARALIAARLGQSETVRTAAATAWGLALPEPGRWTQARGLSVFWTGPDQWLAEADGDGTALLSLLGEKLGGTASLVDQSDAWTCLAVAGPEARAVLEKLCPLDLHPAAFPVGAAARTCMDHLGILIALMDNAPRFQLWVERSAARSFLHAVIQAADSTCGPG